MHVDKPAKLDWLKHQNKAELSPAQLKRWGTICLLNDLLFITTKDSRDKATNKYQPQSFVAFLDDLYTAAYSTAQCPGRLLIDNYVSIALFSLPSLKHIVEKPSTHIIKTPKKVPVSALKQTSSKTMQWLSKRTGRTVQEKISPENKVLTNLTVFSADTKENREAMYLYRILYDIVSKRMINPSAPCPCAKCHDTSCLVPLREINDLILLQSKIKKSELSDVPAQKQTTQNNKLMCDLYYKRIWDAVRMDHEQENHINAVWHKMPNRYLQVAYWLILAGLLRESNCFIYDSWGILVDADGDIRYERIDDKLKDDQDRPWLVNDVTIYSTESLGISYNLTLDGHDISLTRNNDGAIVFTSDFSELLETV